MGRMTGTAGPLMRADAKAMVGTRTDLTPLIGTWVNAKRDTDHIAKVVVRERDGAVLVRMHGSPVDEPVDWGETEATPYAFTGAALVGGFHARYDFDTTRVEIAANVKQGILVIQTYASFHDGSDRMSQFSREFFYQSTAEPEAGVVRTGVDFLAGEWVNTLTTTKWITDFTLTNKGDAVSIRVRGAGEPADWGETEVVTYLDNAGDPAFHASYDLGPIEAELAGNTGKSIIIVAAYLRAKGDSTANLFCREFFVPR